MNVKIFEIEFAKYFRTKYCIGVGNGLDALSLLIYSYLTKLEVSKIISIIN